MSLVRMWVVVCCIALSACAAPSSTQPTGTRAASPQPASSIAASREPVRSPDSSPQPANTAPVKSSGKLSSRLQQLVQSPQLRTASAAEQARALSLPADGPGSLMRDKDGRLLVDIRVSDTSAPVLKSLSDAGAVITNVAEAYQVVTAFARI